MNTPPMSVETTLMYREAAEGGPAVARFLAANGDALARIGRRLRAMPPAVVVLPSATTSWYVDRKEPMETAFLKDLLPEVERRFRVINERMGRVIGGVSMGGYGALRFALKNPEMFASAALVSPAIYVPEPPDDYLRPRFLDGTDS